MEKEREGTRHASEREREKLKAADLKMKGNEITL